MEKSTKQVMIRMTPEMAARIQEQAKTENRSVGSWIKTVLSRFLKKG